MNDHDRTFTTLGAPLILFSFGRSGTHMLIDLIRRQFPAFRALKWPGEPNHFVYGHLDELLLNGRGRGPLLRRLGRSRRPLLMTHRWPEIRRDSAADPALSQWLDRARLIHIVRHPQHAMNSAWPILRMRDAREGAAAQDPVAYARSGGRRWAANLAAMASAPHLFLRYEDVVADPASTVAAIAGWLGAAPVWRSPLLMPPHRSITDCRVSRAIRIDPPSTAVVTRAAWKRRYRLRWSIPMQAALMEEAGEAMATYGYALDEQRSPAAEGAAAWAPVSGLAPSSP